MPMERPIDKVIMCNSCWATNEEAEVTSMPTMLPDVNLEKKKREFMQPKEKRSP